VTGLLTEEEEGKPVEREDSDDDDDAELLDALNRVEAAMDDLQGATQRLRSPRHGSLLDERRRILALARIHLAGRHPDAWADFYRDVHTGATCLEGHPEQVAPPWATGTRAEVYGALEAERKRQDEQWGGWSHDDVHSDAMWIALLTKHAGRAIQQGAFLSQMIRVAAIAVAAIEAFGRARSRAIGTLGASPFPEFESTDPASPKDPTP
jgi:hypothetical protein